MKNEADILEQYPAILEILLQDRTTKKNIIWGTTNYIKSGEFYNAHMEITLGLVKGIRSRIVKSRVLKSDENKSIRTKEKAEVFTPSWLCNKQNNLVDEQWFGRKDMFNKETDNAWEVNNVKIEFDGTKEGNWKSYVDSRRIEVACGEAPYLVSRYDTVTGEKIELKSRIGLLDRKLRVVSENVDNEAEWIKWSERAFQSVYGYDYQGDNVLLARKNLLYTFIDNVRSKFGREPSIKELKNISTIISWNIWQMDGLKFTVPLYKEREKLEQLELFEIDGPSFIEQYCKIRDWRSKVVVEYRTLVTGGN